MRTGGFGSGFGSSSEWGHWGAAGVQQSILNRSTKIESGEQQVTSSLTMASKVEETSEEAKGHKEAEDSMPSPRKTFKVRMVAVRSPTPAIHTAVATAFSRRLSRTWVATSASNPSPTSLWR